MNNGYYSVFLLFFIIFFLETINLLCNKHKLIKTKMPVILLLYKVLQNINTS